MGEVCQCSDTPRLTLASVDQLKPLRDPSSQDIPPFAFGFHVDTSQRTEMPNKGWRHASLSSSEVAARLSGWCFWSRRWFRISKAPSGSGSNVCHRNPQIFKEFSDLGKKSLSRCPCKFKFSSWRDVETSARRDNERSRLFLNSGKNSRATMSVHS